MRGVGFVLGGHALIISSNSWIEVKTRENRLLISVQTSRGLLFFSLCMSGAVTHTC